MLFGCIIFAERIYDFTGSPVAECGNCTEQYEEKGLFVWEMCKNILLFKLVSKNDYDVSVETVHATPVL